MTTPRERLAKREEAIAMIVEEALTDYRCHHSKYPDDGGGMALVDVLSRGPTIEQGQEEIREMAGLVAEVLVSHGWIESGQAGEAPTGESPSVVAGDTRNARSVGPASPAPSLEAREPSLHDTVAYRCTDCGLIRDEPPARFCTQCKSFRKFERVTAKDLRTWLATEQEMHVAWRKRAEEAEAREPLSDRDCEVIRRRLYDAGWYRYDMGNDDIRAVASALRGEG